MTPYYSQLFNMLEEEYSKTIALQKQTAYRYKGKAVYKYRLNIPSDIIEKLGWQRHGIKLRIRVVKNNKLEISVRDSQR